MNILKIKNPQQTILWRWLFIDFIFIILGIRSYLYFDMNSFDGMILMVGITIIITSLFFIKSTLKNIKFLDNAIQNGVMIVHWEYTKKEWENYINNETDYRQNEGKLIAFVLSIITLIVFIPFIIIIDEGQLFMFYVLMVLLILYFFMGMIFPKIVFYFRKKRVGSIILLKKGVLLDKQFHTWDFPLSSFKSASLETKPYKHLAVSYNFIDRTGPRNYVVNVPIPEKNKKNLKKILKEFE